MTQLTQELTQDDIDLINTEFNTRPDANFGDAIEALKLGKKVSRSGWNGKGMYLYYVPANNYPAQTDIAMKTAQGNVVPWLASQTDILAEDWDIK